MVHLRGVVAGCGPRGLEHCSSLRSAGLELAGVADTDPERARRAAEGFGVPAYADVAEMLDDVRPELVVIATPPDVRGGLVQAAASAGATRAVVVEKPLAMRLAEAEQMAATCERHGVLLTAVHQLRYVPGFARLKRAIDAGELGELEFIRGVSFGGLFDQGPHLVDAMRWLTGGARVRWVMSQRGDALAGRLDGGSGSTGLPDWTVHHLCFEGGARASLETGPLHQRSRSFVDDFLDKRVMAIGSEAVGECGALGPCRILGGEGAEVAAEGTLDDYAEATTRFHQDLAEALLDGRPAPITAADALASLESILACAQSLVDGDAAELPLDRHRDPVGELSGARPVRPPKPLLPTDAAERLSRAGPEVSVILPLPDHRGYGEDAVRSWIEQTIPGDSFELVLASDGTEPDMEARVEAMLRPADQLVRIEGAHEIRLYDEAARVARGRVLFLTEPHCIAEPQCLEELTAYLRRTDYDGCCCRSTPLGGNRLAEMEERLYEEGFREWSKPGHWCKLILRGFAVNREVFLDAGGFETEYDRFAEFALAARLHQLGRRLGYAAGACVRHAYTTSFADLAPPIRAFSRGELMYRETHPPDYCERYFGEAPEWNGRRRLDRESARAACRIAGGALLRPRNWRPAAVRTLIGALRRHAGPALLGARGRLARARMAFWMARARTLLWRGLSRRRLERAYRDAYMRMISEARLEYLADRPPSAAPESETGREFSLADTSDDRLFGFHRVETAAGSAFRWAMPVAFADLPLEPADYAVEIETAGIRGEEPPVLELSFNGRRIEPETLRVDSGRIGFELAPEMFVPGRDQRLAIVCPPVATPPEETRDLGLPVVAITGHPN